MTHVVFLQVAGEHSLDRCFQALLIVSTAGLSWLLMLAVHESGHVLLGWLTGAQHAVVHLPLLGISRTDFAVNPHPLLVAWGGALWGCALPAAVLAAARCFAARQHVYLLVWFAGFCLIANGAYLLGGAILTGGLDDGGVILQHGGSRWHLLTFGVAAVAAGLYLWNGLGPYFGLGPSRGRVSRKAAVGVAVALAVVACAVALTANW
jgi:hypothetical protein